ncbi:MAG: hypothetical protein H8K03_19125 [Nitrospira sp.]
MSNELWGLQASRFCNLSDHFTFINLTALVSSHIPALRLREVMPPDWALISPSVWRHLTRSLREDSEEYSLREFLILRWWQDGRFVEVGSEREKRRIALFFGDGGSYYVEDLRARAAMLDLLESDINLMSQDLERLLGEILLQDAS